MLSFIVGNTGRKASLTTESDKNETATEEDSSATDVDSSATIINNSGSSTRRGKSRKNNSNETPNQHNDEERYNSRGTRRKRINYRELNGSDCESEKQTVISSRGRIIRIKRNELHSY